MSDRGTHPDLLEETSNVETSRGAVGEAAEVTPEEAPTREARPRARGRGSRQAPSPPANPPGEVVVDGQPEDGGEAPVEPPSDGDPEWLRAAREAKAAPDMLATILKNVPLDELQKHPQISGWIGNMAQRTAQQQAVQKQIEEAEREKAAAWQRGDYYRLGELSASEVEARAQQAQQAQASEPFMRSVTEYQRALPEAVQLEIQGKNYASMADYLKAAHEATVRYEVDQRVQSEIKKREPALAKAALSATVGAEQSPERAGGPSPGVREITDAEIDRMSLAEYEQYFDGNGHPRNGVRLRLTRGVDVSRR